MSVYVTLDSLNLDRDKPGFIKIDVDGPECDVLDSGARLLSKADVCLLVETHSLELELGCIDRLEKLGYVCSVIRNAWWRIFVPEQRPIAHNRWLWAEKCNFSINSCDQGGSEAGSATISGSAIRP